MDEIIEWYNERLSDYLEDAKANDGLRGTMTRVTKQCVQLVRALIAISDGLFKSNEFCRAIQSTRILESMFSDLRLTRILTPTDAVTALHGEVLLSIARCALNINTSSRTRLAFTRLCSGEPTF